MAGTLFASVQIIDGSGAEPFKGHVLVEGDRIQRARRRELTSDMAPRLPQCWWQSGKDAG